jgi:hypothetical protein
MAHVGKRIAISAHGTNIRRMAFLNGRARLGCNEIRVAASAIRSTPAIEPTAKVTKAARHSA